MKTFPQYSQVSFRDRPVRSLRASGSKRAASRPLAAMALRALGSIGGSCTPGGKGGRSISEIDDRFRPVREVDSLLLGDVVEADDDLGKFLKRSRAACPPGLVPGIQRPAKRLEPAASRSSFSLLAGSK